MIHQYTSPAEAIFANAFIIELENRLVVVDATLTVSSSTALNEQIHQLEKRTSRI